MPTFFSQWFRRSGAVQGVAGLLAGVCLTAEAAAAPSQLPRVLTTVKPEIVVSGPNVRLGDLFANVGPQAETIVAAAPPPGGRSIIDRRRLAQLAAAYGLNWHPQTDGVTVNVVRDGVSLGRDDIERVIRDAATSRGVLPGPFMVDFTGPLPSIVIAAAASATIEVQDLAVDTATRRFQAVLVPTGDGQGERRFTVNGRLHPMSTVPVLVRAIARGETIDARDIEYADVREDRLSNGTAGSEEDIVGLCARRPLRPGVPIRVSDLEKQEVIAKGEAVLLVIAIPGMTLTARGRALENGAVGDTVRAVNLQGNGVVEGVATGPGRIEVPAMLTSGGSLRR